MYTHNPRPVTARLYSWVNVQKISSRSEYADKLQPASKVPRVKEERD
jgi:hypothetical protein